jgi:hypothetical protein
MSTPSDDATQIMWETRGKAEYNPEAMKEFGYDPEALREYRASRPGSREYRFRLDAAMLAARTIGEPEGNERWREEAMARHVRFWEDYLRTGVPKDRPL